MKIIDLLNKIANGEEVPEYITYKNKLNGDWEIMLVCKENIIYKLDQLIIELNDKVLISEQHRKDEFKDIEEIPFNNGMNSLLTIYEEIEKMNYAMNDLIRNQKKIIAKLGDNK